MMTPHFLLERTSCKLRPIALQRFAGVGAIAIEQRSVTYYLHVRELCHLGTGYLYEASQLRNFPSLQL